MKLALILTNDWELFGDGSGDFFDVQAKPLIEFLDIAEKYNAKMTLMADVMQQFVFKEQTTEKAHLIASEWERLVRETIVQGSDVQLHIHSQWVGAKNIEGNSPQLNMEHWSIASLDEKTISSIISKGKKYLEDTIRVVKPDYNCTAFRAGAYCIEPSSKVIPALKINGFECDTSVTKHLFSEGYFDYSDANSALVPWAISERSVKYKDQNENSLFEFPIYSDYKIDSHALKKLIPNLYYLCRYGKNISKHDLDWFKEKERVKSLRYPKANRFYKKNVNKNLKWYLNAIISKQVTQLDYDHIPAAIFVKILEKLLKKFTNLPNNMYLPIVASGHFKDIHNCENLEKIMKIVKNVHNSEIEFWTLSEAVLYWKQNNLQIEKELRNEF